MPKLLYKVVFTGRLSDGVRLEQAKQALGKLYKKDAAWVDCLFTGKPVSIKSTDDLKDAMKYIRAFKQCGAEAEIVRASKAEGMAKPAAVKPSKEVDKRVVIQHAFKGDIEPLKPEFSYRITIVLVAISMLLLPLLYVALAVGIAYGSYQFAISSDVIGTLRHGGWVGVVAYFGMIVGGIATVLLMLKPIFSQFGGSAPRFVLGNSEQRLLSELVELIAEKVGAPIPAEIVVDAQVNASASWIDGAFSRRQLRLTIGLPLILVTNIQQLSGIIAHELGHFSQTTGMGVTLLIGRINYWFYIAATGQDPWDDKFDQFCERTLSEEDSEKSFGKQVLGMLLMFVMLCLWLSRQMIAVFWKICELISSSISRQMEFDADRYEIHLVGSQVFEETSLHLPVASEAYQQAADIFQHVLHSDNQLVDDFSKLTQLSMQQIRSEDVQRIQRNELSRITSRFDSHPATKERIAKARDEACAGIFQLDKPSTWLFENVSALSEKYTLWHYRHVMEIRAERSQLIEASSLFEKDKQTTEEQNHMGEHALSKLPCFFRLPISSDMLSSYAEQDITAEHLKTQLNEHMEHVDQLTSQVKLASKRFEQAGERILALKHALFLAQAGIPFDAKSYRVRDCDEATIQQSLEKSYADLDEINNVLNAYAKQHIQVFLWVMRLQSSPKQELLDEFITLLNVFAVIEGKKENIYDIWLDSQVLSSFSEYFDDEKYGDAFHRFVGDSYRQNKKRLQRLFQQLEQINFPFDHGGDGKRTVANAIFQGVSVFADESSIGECMHHIPQGYFSFRGRVLGRILRIRDDLIG